MLENVRGLLDPVFDDYRAKLISDLKKLGYCAEWRLINAHDFGVSQLRPRVIFVALKKNATDYFVWPSANPTPPPTVGETLFDLMASNGWRGAQKWRDLACDIGPTLVGGSKKHGGPDLGPTRAKKAWACIGVDGMGIADHVPDKDYVGMPRRPCVWQRAFKASQTIGSLVERKPQLTGKLATRFHPLLRVLWALKS